MNPIKRKLRPGALVVLLLQTILVVALTNRAQAAREDVAMFYEELAPYGNWVDYGKYGPVWYPTKGVSENWRPYLDGRWQPSDAGWVFETTEPWGWATYHYGNWMPTEDYGWVWAPGSTWYPSTAAWRTSDDYIGWAPIPPPNYEPPPAYYPAGGYYPGAPVLSLITAPFWIFARAASFLLGFGQPYAPGYSYYNCGCLAPFGTIPTIYPRTALLTNYYYPSYAPYAYYVYGPSYPFISRVCRVPIVRIHNFVRRKKFRDFRYVVPPHYVLNRRPYLRRAIPDAVLEGRDFTVRRVRDVRVVEPRLVRPDVVRPPRDLPEVPRIEGARPERLRPAVRPEALRPGTAERRAPERAAPERVLPQRLRPARPEAEARRGVLLPPQAVPDSRDMQDQLRRERRIERRQVPQVQQRRFQREERQLRQQEIFRTPRARQPEAVRPRIQRQPQPRRAPQIRQPRPAPSRTPGRSFQGLQPQRGR
ncbi:MAG: hypothetical protein QME75_01575 [Deltaproteobacteria bacterium]|nr:hypothetical protein [Deltaproteobacteria bacterium]